MAAVPRTGGLLISSALISCRRRVFSPVSSCGRLPFCFNEKGSGYRAPLRPSVLPSLYARRSYSSLAPHAAAEAFVEDVQPPTPLSDPLKEAAGALDIRVGRILRARVHPEADSLYVEEVDVGEAEPRTICSGLVNYIPLDHLEDIKVVVLANLKPRNMRGVKSNGMLMAASDTSHETLELLIPPEGSFPGERIWFGVEEEKDKQPDAATPNQVQKKKIWESVQPHLRTTETCIAVLGAHPMRTSAGVVACKSLKNANIY